MGELATACLVIASAATCPPKPTGRREAIQSPARRPGLLRFARNDGESYAFFSTDTKNPSVPVRRGVISQPSGWRSAASANASALSHKTLAVCSGG